MREKRSRGLRETRTSSKAEQRLRCASYIQSRSGSRTAASSKYLLEREHEHVVFNRLASVDVLVIDEMGYLNLRPEQTNVFFKLMEERYRRRPTLITTNLDYDDWATFLGNKTLVDALINRLQHQCHTVRIKGESLRIPQSP